jgi:hypothetical protein
VPLTVSITGNGAVGLNGGRHFTCASASCRRTFLVRAGSTVTLTAQAGSGWKFGTWGGCRTTAATCRLRVNRAVRVGVTFIPPGAQSNPIPLGQAATIRNVLQEKVVSVTPDAWQQISQVTFPNGELANTDPPPPGAQDFMLLLSVTYTGGGKATLSEMGLTAVGSHNASYGAEDDWCGFLPAPDLSSFNVDVFSGQTITGYVCFQIAENDADSLLLRDGDTWFALR